MIRVSKKIEYALLALGELDRQTLRSPLSARELAHALALPYDTLAKILKSLNQHHWLTSIQGTKGGYQLAIDLNRASYLDLTQVLDERLDNLDCQGADGCRNEKGCHISAPLKSIDRLMLNFFKNLPIKALLSEENHLSLWSEHLLKFPQVSVAAKEVSV